MYKDSQIAAEVLEHFTDDWTPLLCIHDSFIIDHTRTMEFIEVMHAATTRLLGGPLRISQDYPGLDQFVSSPHGYTEADHCSFRGFPERSEGYRRRYRRFLERLES